MTTLQIPVTIGIVLSACVHIRAEYTKRLQLIYIFKPLTTSLIIVFCVLQSPELSSVYTLFILGGLLCSLIGDIFLMLPSDQFIPGLISFLIAHLLYISAFVQANDSYLTIWLLLPIGALGIVLLKVLLPHTGKTTVPVIIYTTVILAMLWQALERWSVLSSQSAIAAVLGAALFVISDYILAYNRFVKTFAYGRLLNLVTYFAAQWLLAFSVRL